MSRCLRDQDIEEDGDMGDLGDLGDILGDIGDLLARLATLAALACQGEESPLKLKCIHLIRSLLEELVTLTTPLIQQMQTLVSTLADFLNNHSLGNR